MHDNDLLLPRPHPHRFGQFVLPDNARVGSFALPVEPRPTDNFADWEAVNATPRCDQIRPLLPSVRETREGARATAPHRSMFHVSEVRVETGTDGKKKLVGYAAVFDSPSRPLSTKSGKQFIEKIAPGAFRAALAANPQPDIPLLVGHDPNKVLARTAGGAGTLKLAEDTRGLKFEAQLPDTQLARDVAADVDHGNIKGMSFGFGDPEDEWEQGDANGGMPLRTLKSVPLGEVSATPYPAYEATTVDVREMRAIEQAIARVEAGEKNVRCGGYRDDEYVSRNVRAACGSVMQHSRMLHDAMENALHVISKRDDDDDGDEHCDPDDPDYDPDNPYCLDEHEQRAVRDMCGHVRQMIGKVAALRGAVGPMDEGEWPALDPEGESETQENEQRARMIRMAAEMEISPTLMQATLAGEGQRDKGTKGQRGNTRAGHMTHAGGISLNSAGVEAAKKLIDEGKVDDGEWSFTAEDEDALLGPQKDPQKADWDGYSKWFLSIDKNADPKSKQAYKYPYGKAGKVFTRALAAIRSRASQQDAKPVFDAAGELLDAASKKKA